MSNSHFSTRNDQENREQYLTITKALRKRLSIEQIQKMWNASGLGKPAKETTINRWLNVGPETKNPNFEPFVMGLSVGLNSVHGRTRRMFYIDIPDNVTPEDTMKMLNRVKKDIKTKPLPKSHNSSVAK